MVASFRIDNAGESNRRAEQAPLQRDVTFVLQDSGESAGSLPISINLSSERDSRDSAVALINRRYDWRGYGSNHKLSGRSNEATFTVRRGNDVIGTVTLACDSHRGLDVERTFPEEMRFLRRKPFVRPCELKKLAVDCSIESKPVLAAMFHFAFLFGRNNDWGSDIFIEVNPRHVRFYERMLGFQKVGAPKTNTSVCAPAQLMWLPVSTICSYFESARETQRQNSLYRYFLSRDEELAIISDLKNQGLIVGQESLRDAFHGRSHRMAALA